ncbi:MAG: hypothetical protein AB1545_06545 [Thermodesulfobacteriota bacterium]
MTASLSSIPLPHWDWLAQELSNQGGGRQSSNRQESPPSSSLVEGGETLADMQQRAGWSVKRSGAVLDGRLSAHALSMSR